MPDVVPRRPAMIEPGTAGESFPEDIPALRAALDDLGGREELWNTYIKELSALEDPARGVYYAAELHEARQYRMMLRYRKDFCLARIRRLELDGAGA